MNNEITAQEAFFLYQQNVLTYDECTAYLSQRANMVRNAIANKSYNNAEDYEDARKVSNPNVEPSVQLR